MKVRRFILSVFGLGLAPLLHALAYVPDIDEPFPLYFSGTNCRARGTVYGDPPPPGATHGLWLTDVWLYVGPVGGEILVREWHHAPEPEIVAEILADSLFEPENPMTPVTEISLSVMFDSSYFNPDTLINVKIVAYDSFGRYYEASSSAFNKNRARCWNHAEFDIVDGGDGASIAAAWLSPMKYATTEHHGIWNTSTFLSLFKDSVVYVNSHGGPGIHESGDGDTIDFGAPTGGYIEARTNLNGSGLPPLNNTQNPPINLLLLEVCEAVEGGSALNATLPFGNEYNPNSFENQAVHGYTVFTRVADSEITALVLFLHLSAGKSISHVTAILQAVADEMDILCSDVENGTNRPMDLSTDQAILGDTATRIKNVYTGGTGKSATWFRPMYSWPIG